MRLRPTACGSTLRETARPSRAGGGPATKCSENSGEAVRRPCWKARSNSARARTRTWRGKRAFMGETVRSRPSASAGRGETASGRQALAALGAAAGDDLAAVGGLHAGTDAVVALALEVAGLVGALGGHGGTRADTRRKEPESLLCDDLAGQAGARSQSRRRAERPVGTEGDRNVRHLWLPEH